VGRSEAMVLKIVVMILVNLVNELLCAFHQLRVAVDFARCVVVGAASQHPTTSTQFEQSQ
jgi:hypothetical protein